MRNATRLYVLFLGAALGAVHTGTASACVPDTTECRPSACPRGATIVSPGPPATNVIQAAINAAANGATICARPGTYTGLIDFKGKRITLVSTNGPGSTILSGASAGTVVTFKTFEAADSVLDGFSIVQGKAPFGGGIYIQDASPTIHNVYLKGNQATGDAHSRGGGIAVRGASAKPVITCTQFLGNKSSYGAGGLSSLYYADPYLRFDYFEGNTAPYGGAIGVAASGRLDLGRSCFLANSAGTDGGAIHAGVAQGNVLVRQSCFEKNRAGSQGGAIWLPAGFAEVINSSFIGNQAPTGGGIAAGFGGMASVAGSLFVNNTNPALLKVNTPAGTSTSVVNHYNAFFPAAGAYSGTYGDLGVLALTAPIDACCPPRGSPTMDKGVPDIHFNDVDGSRNDIGACGGPRIY